MGATKVISVQKFYRFDEDVKGFSGTDQVDEEDGVRARKDYRRKTIAEKLQTEAEEAVKALEVSALTCIVNLTAAKSPSNGATKTCSGIVSKRRKCS